MPFLILVYCAVVLGACRVRLGEARQYTMKYAPPADILFPSCGQRGRALEALCCEISFHALCVYWFLLVFRQNQSRYCQKAKSPLHLLSWKEQNQSEKMCKSSVWMCWMTEKVFVCVCVCVSSLCYSTFTLRGLSFGFLRRSEAQGFAQRARPRHADGLDMHNVVCLFLQVP